MSYEIKQVDLPSAQQFVTDWADDRSCRPKAIVVPFLMPKRDKVLVCVDKKNTSPHEFFFPGGGVNDNELIIDAALRELNEEIGLKGTDVLRIVFSGLVKIHTLSQAGAEKRGYKKIAIFPFGAAIRQNAVITPDMEEVTGVYPMSRQEFAKAGGLGLVSPTARFCMDSTTGLRYE